jgi:hypothetical protein
MKNDRTPRTLADAGFTTGYPRAPIPTHRRVNGGAVALWLTLLGLWALLGVLLAWRG